MPRKKTARTTANVPPPSEAPWGRAELLLEDIRDKLGRVLEARALDREAFERRFDELERRLGERLSSIEAVAKYGERRVAALEDRVGIARLT